MTKITSKTTELLELANSVESGPNPQDEAKEDKNANINFSLKIKS
jgi:hypothetical protein